MTSDPATQLILVFAGSVGAMLGLVGALLFVFGNRRK